MVLLLSYCALIFSTDRPMSQWNIDALVFLQGKLKENVFMSTGLSDILQTAADGFMSATEERQVKKQHGNDEQMGKLIEILKGKQDKDFKTFLKMLRKTNQGVWADELERKAEEFRQERSKCTQLACVVEGVGTPFEFIYTMIFIVYITFCMYLLIPSNSFFPIFLN